jgi:hypothetical protein
MGKPRKQFQRGAIYKVSKGGFDPVKVTYWGKFRGPESERKHPTETFLIFRVEPDRPPREE